MLWDLAKKLIFKFQKLFFKKIKIQALCGTPYCVNLCLGLPNKKEYVHQTLNDEKIDVCLQQEVEIVKDYHVGILTSKNYKIEVEKNAKKARCAIVIKDNINYTRRSDLEEADTRIVVIDINSNN